MDIQPVAGRAAPATAPAEKPAPSGGQAAVAIKSAQTPVVQTANVEQPVSVPDPDAVKQAVQNLNKMVKGQFANLEFSLDSDSNRAVVKLVDNETNEVIRQFPSEEALALSKAIDQVQGLLLRDQA